QLELEASRAAGGPRPEVKTRAAVLTAGGLMRVAMRSTAARTLETSSLKQRRASGRARAQARPRLAAAPQNARNITDKKRVPWGNPWGNRRFPHEERSSGPVIPRHERPCARELRPDRLSGQAARCRVPPGRSQSP